MVLGFDGVIGFVIQWFLIGLFVAEAAAKGYLNREHQFGIVEDHDLYDQISQDQRGTALTIAALVFAALTLLLSENPEGFVAEIEVLIAAFGFLLIAAFTHELTLTYRLVLTLQEMALEYGLLLLVFGVFLLIIRFVPSASGVAAVVFIAVLSLRFYSVIGELEGHREEGQSV